MPQFNYDYPIGVLGQLAVYDPARIDSLGVLVPSQADEIAIGGVDLGTYTVRIEGEEGIFDTDFVVGGVLTADQIADGIAAALEANALLENIVDAAGTPGTPVLLSFKHPGLGYTISFPSNPGGNMSLTNTQSATGTPIPLGVGVTSDDGITARLPQTGDTAADFWGCAVRNADLVQGLDTNQPTFDQYLPADELSACREGEIWVRPEVAVSVNDPVYWRVTATGTEQAGAFSNVDDGGDNVLLAGRWRTAAAAGGLARLILNTP